VQKGVKENRFHLQWKEGGEKNVDRVLLGGGKGGRGNRVSLLTHEKKKGQIAKGGGESVLTKLEDAEGRH